MKTGHQAIVFSKVSDDNCHILMLRIKLLNIHQFFYQHVANVKA